MKKTAFVPSPDILEGRIALSSGTGGAAVLREHTLNQAVAQIEGGFARFAHDRMNYTRLEFDLAKAVGRIPWNRRDGLLATVEFDVQDLKGRVDAGETHPIKTEMRIAVGQLEQFVKYEVANGVIKLV